MRWRPARWPCCTGRRESVTQTTRPRRGRGPRTQRTVPAPRSVEMGLALEPAKVRIVAIGASTGGPPALHTILAGLPRDFPVPLVIVQHMAAGFVGGLVEWLGEASRPAPPYATHR